MKVWKEGKTGEREGGFDVDGVDSLMSQKCQLLTDFSASEALHDILIFPQNHQQKNPYVSYCTDEIFCFREDMEDYGDNEVYYMGILLTL